jgi:hypothetical protein
LDYSAKTSRQNGQRSQLLMLPMHAWGQLGGPQWFGKPLSISTTISNGGGGLLLNRKLFFKSSKKIINTSWNRHASYTVFYGLV